MKKINFKVGGIQPQLSEINSLRLIMGLALMCFRKGKELIAKRVVVKRN